MTGGVLSFGTESKGAWCGHFDYPAAHSVDTERFKELLELLKLFALRESTPVAQQAATAQLPNAAG